MESLNKNQIVLLTLLVSFVTSIATGITTVTLMDQAPAGVTQTVNRIVERTIERVVPGEIQERTVIKEVPIIVTEEELVVQVIDQTAAAVVRLETRDGEPLGSGFLANDDGLILSVASFFASAKNGQPFTVGFRSGGEATARLIKSSPAADIVALKIDEQDLATIKSQLAAAALAATSTSPAAASWRFLSAETVAVAPGQTVISLGSPDEGPINVSVGIVSAAGVAGEAIRTNAANQYNLGGPVLNTKGQLVGLSREPGFVVGAPEIAAFISSLNS